MLNTGCMKHDGANLGSSHHHTVNTSGCQADSVTAGEKLEKYNEIFDIILKND